MRRMTTVLAMVARCRVDSLHVLTKDSAMTGSIYASTVLIFLGRVCSAVEMGGGRPLRSPDELISMAFLTSSWWMLLMADL